MSPQDHEVGLPEVHAAAPSEDRGPGSGLPGARGRGALCTAALALALLGAGLAGARIALVDAGALPRLAADGRPVWLTGRIATDPRPVQGGAWALLAVRSADGQAVRERTLLRFADPDTAPALGTLVTFRGALRVLDREGFESFLRLQGAGTAVLGSPPVRVRGAPPLWLAATERVRDRTRAATQALEPDRAALVGGLVTGDTRGLSPEAEDELRAAGLTHLVAVSGANVALLLAGVALVCGALGIGARGRRRAGGVAIVWFVILVRAEPSVLRAAVMAGLVLAAGTVGRPRDPRHVLAMAVIVLLLANPLLAGQLGFVLSVLATAGVLVGGPVLARRLPGPRRLRLLLAATAGAQLGVAPALLVVQGAVPLAALPANLVAVPAAAVASVIGTVAALVAQLSLTAGTWCARLAAAPAAVVLWAGRAFASGPALRPAHLLTPVVVVGAVAWMGRRRWPRSAAVLAVIGLALGVWPRLTGPARPTGLTLTAFDVGEGEALLVESPPAHRLLVDGGPEPGQVLALLRARRIRQLDAVVTSHPHADHAGGLPAVLGHLPVGAYFTAPTGASPADAAPAAAEALATAERRGVPVRSLAAGDRFALGEASVEVLWPPRDEPSDPETNNRSLVLRVTSPDGSILLTGDAEAAAQARLLRSPDRLAVDVLKVPHHGGDTNADGFLAATTPEVAVISAGEGNDFGHPHTDVLADLAGVDVRRTDQDGDVIVPLGQ